MCYASSGQRRSDAPVGRASALALRKAGAQVLVHYGRAASEADAAVDQIKGDGGRARAIAADLATAEGP